MKNTFNVALVGSAFLLIVLGCGGDSNSAPSGSTPSNSSATDQSGSSPVASEKAVAIQAKALTKEYDENELAADGKYKGKLLAVSGKVSNIAETLGNVTVQLEGHEIMATVMCSFDEAEKSNVAKLKKGQQSTLVGTGDGKTMGIYVGLQHCKIL